MADCPSCGSILKYDIPSQTVICTSCSNQFRPEDVGGAQSAQEQNLMGMTEFLCPNCGGEIFSTDKDITGVCSYCGSGVVFESRLSMKQRPRYIIPFQKTKEDCKDIYLAYLGKKLFVPKELKDPQYLNEFRGIYMPYWLADVKHTGDVRYYARDSREKKDLVTTDTYRITGDLDVLYEGLYHDAGTGFSDDISEKLEPYYLTGSDQKGEMNVKPFYPAYLSGFYAEPCDVDAKEYEAYFQDIADRETENYLQHHSVLKGAAVKSVSESDYEMLDLMEDLNERQEDVIRTQILSKGGVLGRIDRKALKEYRRLQEDRERETKEALKEKKKSSGSEKSEDASSISARYGYATTQSEQLALFRVWFMSWRNKDRVAYVTVNGQTGSVVADLPIDLKKFFMTFAICFAVLFAAFSLVTIRSYTMPVVAVWFSAVIIHMAFLELKLLRDHSMQEVIHKKRGSKLDSGTLGFAALIVMIVVVIIGLLIKYFFKEDLEFLTSHFFYCIYVLLGLGYAAVMTFLSLVEWIRIKAAEKTIPLFVLAAVSAVIGTLLVLSNTPNDVYLYGGTAIAFACSAITMLSMILQFNKVITRPLPQFEHKGGDDRA